MVTAAELNAMVAAQGPIKPTGAATAFIIVSAICWALSAVAIGLRICSRAFNKGHSIWGWDDTLAVAGMVAFTGVTALAIVCSLYGVGMHEGDDSLPLAVKSVLFYKWWEVAYCVSISLTRTSIGVAILRIAVQRSHRLACWACILISDTCYFAGFLWAIAHCHHGDYPFHALYGTCGGDNIIVPLSYINIVVSAFCDAGLALVPFLVVRDLQMRPSMKYTLMVVMAMGSSAAMASVARFPWVQYMPARLGTIYRSVYMPLLSNVENAIGLVFGSLPAIGKMLHLFEMGEAPKRTYPSDGVMGNHTFGGTPFSREPRELQLVPQGKGQNHTRIWSESKGVSDAGQGTIDEPEP